MLVHGGTTPLLSLQFSLYDFVDRFRRAIAMTTILISTAETAAAAVVFSTSFNVDMNFKPHCLLFDFRYGGADVKSDHSARRLFSQIN